MSVITARLRSQHMSAQYVWSLFWCTNIVTSTFVTHAKCKAVSLLHKLELKGLSRDLKVGHGASKHLSGLASAIFSMLQLPQNLAGDGRQPNWYEEIHGAVLWNGLLDGDWHAPVRSVQLFLLCNMPAGDCRDGNAKVLILLASIMWFRHVQERRSWSACLVTTQ